MEFIEFKGEKIKVKDNKLVLSNMGINDITEIKGLENLLNLKRIDFSRNLISEINGLENLQNLDYLNLADNKITEIRGLENLQNLEVLNLYQNYITAIKGLDTLKSLKILWLSFNRISDIEGLDNLSNLEDLRINGNKITTIKGLENLKNLKILDISRNPIPEYILYKLGFGLTFFTGKEIVQGIVEHCRRIKLPIKGGFKINEYITLKLENNETAIYLGGIRFMQCQISPEAEFRTHCSNMQVWAESNYDTQLLRPKLAFRLLKALTSLGDPNAKKVFREEIAKRLKEGNLDLIQFLINEKYLEYLNKEELDESLNGLDSNLPTELQKFLEKECLPSDKLILLRDLTHVGSRYAEIVLLKKITELANSDKYDDHVKIIKDHYLYYLSEENFVKFFSNSRTDFLEWLFVGIDCNPMYYDEYECENNDYLNLKRACRDIVYEIKMLPPKLYSKWLGNILSNASKKLCDLLLKLKFFEILISSSYYASSYYEGLKDFLKDKNFILYNYVVVYKKKIYALKDNNEILFMSDSNIVGTLDIRDIIGIHNHTSIKKLNLSNNKITKIKGLEILKNLEHLDLSNNKITEIKGLDSFINLKSLNLICNEVKTIKGLNYLRNLRELSLGNKIKEIKGLENLEKLESLNLYGNSIFEIKGLENLQNLKKLILSNNKITKIKGLESLNNLRELDLSENQIVEIEGLESLNNLRELDLNENQIVEIKGLDNLVKLFGLSLNSNKITEIRGLEMLKELEYLRLNRNQIKEIEGLENLSNLLELDLWGNNISEIKGLEKAEELRELNIYQNRIPKEMLEQLGRLGFSGEFKNPQKVVEYCRLEKEKQKNVVKRK